jgi:Glycosyltransferase family 87
VIPRTRQLAKLLEKPTALRIVIALFIAVAAIFTFVPFIRFLRHGTDLDYRTWYDAAQAVLHHRDIYPQNNTFTFMYPPPCALALAFPAIFGKAAMILLLTLLNTAAWVLCVRFSLSLARERRFPVAVALIPNLIVIVFVWSSYHLGQPSLLLLALMLGAFVSLRRKWQILAGTLIAAAAAIKAFPFLAIIYLIYRRYWTAAISVLIALLVFLFVLPIPFRGISQTRADFDAWQRGMLRYQSGGIAQRSGRGYSWKNQSLFGLANRILRPVSVNDEGEPAVYANIADLDFRAINSVILASALLLGLWFLAAMIRARAQLDGAKPSSFGSPLSNHLSQNAAGAHRNDALEFGALLILILLFTPLAFGYLFSWLMLPLAALTKRVLDSGSALALSTIVAATALLTATAISTRGAQIYGSVFFAALVLYFGATIELWRAGKAAVAAEP